MFDFFRKPKTDNYVASQGLTPNPAMAAALLSEVLGYELAGASVDSNYETGRVETSLYFQNAAGRRRRAVVDSPVGQNVMKLYESWG